MEKQVNGIIEKIEYGSPQNGNYGMQSKCYVTIQGETYSCFVKEYNGTYTLKTKQGSTYMELKVGMQVVFTATSWGNEEKGGWNFRSSDVTILASGMGAQNPPVAQQPTPQEKVAENAPHSPSWDDIDKQLSMGMAAMMVCMKFRGKVLPGNVVDGMERLAKKYFNDARK